MVCLWAECMFVLELYLASKSFVAVREEFRSAYSDKEVRNKTILHWLVTTFRDTEVFVTFEEVVDMWRVAVLQVDGAKS
jgi:hypothetical protein